MQNEHSNINSGLIIGILGIAGGWAKTAWDSFKRLKNSADMKPIADQKLRLQERETYLREFEEFRRSYTADRQAMIQKIGELEARLEDAEIHRVEAEEAAEKAAKQLVTRNKQYNERGRQIDALRKQVVSMSCRIAYLEKLLPAGECPSPEDFDLTDKPRGSRRRTAKNSPTAQEVKTL
jgi:hypothetical protein